MISRNASTLVYVAYKKWESSCSPVSATVISNPPWRCGPTTTITTTAHRNTPNHPPAKVPSHRATLLPFPYAPHFFPKVTLPQNLIVGLSPKSRETSNRLDQDKWKPIFASLQTNSWSLGDGPFPESSDRKLSHFFIIFVVVQTVPSRHVYIIFFSRFFSFL